MCTTEQYLTTPNPPAVTQNAWIQPRMVVHSSNTGQIVDFSGEGLSNNGYGTCDQWNSSLNTRYALTITATTGIIRQLTCDNMIRVACCGYP